MLFLTPSKIFALLDQPYILNLYRIYPSLPCLTKIWFFVLFCFLLSRFHFYWPPWAEVIDHPTGLELIHLKTIFSHLPLPLRTIQPSPSSSRLHLFFPLRTVLYWMFFGNYHLDAKSNRFHVLTWDIWFYWPIVSSQILQKLFLPVSPYMSPAILSISCANSS